MVIDAQKQPGWTTVPQIELDGTAVGGADGLTIKGGDSVIRGLVINRFGAGSGIGVDTAGGNTIQGCYIGTDATGGANAANAYGVFLSSGGNTLGGTTVTARNVISGNQYANVYISGSSNNIVRGSYIGIDATGASLLGGNNGIVIEGAASSNTIGGTTPGEGNRIAGHASPGIRVMGTTATGNAILGNHMYANFSIGIDLADDWVTANDGSKTAGQPNLLMDFPVFTEASLVGTSLAVAGYVGSAPGQAVFANARVEVFESDVDASGYGEGKTYLGFLTTDANGNFSGTLDVTGKGLLVGEKVTGTATDGSNNTSEFGANATVADVYTVSGRAFEDVNYGGGAGRNWTTASGNGGSARSAARVELFNGGGAFVTSTVTDGSGNYTFTSVAAGNYSIRVVSSSVTSSRTGYVATLVPVMTFRTNASTGTAVEVTDYVGGHDPATADAGDAVAGWILNATTGVFSGNGAGKAHAFAPVTVSAANVTGVDFGWNFDAVVNTNNTGQGSLRQFLTNANTLGDDGSLAQSGLVVAKENAVFMISNGTAAPGLRAANNSFVGGAATINPTAALPQLRSPMVLDASKQPGWAAAPIVEIYGGGIAAATDGLTIKGGSSTLRSLIVNGFTQNAAVVDSLGGNTIAACYLGLGPDGATARPNFGKGIVVRSGSNQIGGTGVGDGNVISGNLGGGLELVGAAVTGNVVRGNSIGTDASGTIVRGNSGNGLTIRSGANGNTVGGTQRAARNVISGNGTGISVSNAGTTNNTILGNVIGTDRSGLLDFGNGGVGITIFSSASGNTVGGTTVGARNIISGNGTRGIFLNGPSTTGNVVLGNYIGVDSTGVAILRNDQEGIQISGAAHDNTVGGTVAGAGNIIAGNGGDGVYVTEANAVGNRILGNTTFANTGLGIDLDADGVNANNGTKTASLPNYDMDFPVITHGEPRGREPVRDGVHRQRAGPVGLCERSGGDLPVGRRRHRPWRGAHVPGLPHQ